MLTSRISAKGQLTIPSEVRKRLRLRPGDTIAYAVSGETATIRKIDPLDAGFLRLANDTFADWNAPEADEAFRDL
jgi:AbrB family looped-hinge helix DNA binding protein